MLNPEQKGQVWTLFNFECDQIIDTVIKVFDSEWMLLLKIRNLHLMIQNKNKKFSIKLHILQIQTKFNFGTWLKHLENVAKKYYFQSMVRFSLSKNP